MTKVLILLIAIINFGAIAQEKNKTDIGFEHSASMRQLDDKNFYLLTAIKNNLAIRELLENDSDLIVFSKLHQADLLEKSVTVDNSLNNLILSYKFKDLNINAITLKLKSLAKDNDNFKKFIREDLRASGKYQNFQQESDDIFIAKAWGLCAAGLNRIIGVYGLGEQAQYSEIDSVSYDLGSSYYRGSLAMWSDYNLRVNHKVKPLFFETTLNFCNSLLYLNHRDEAIRYDPLSEKENKISTNFIHCINFKDFEYSAILILGNGPENYHDRLSALGKLNLKLGVMEFYDKKAPIIIVSGGHAHPFRAPYCEAIEMKKELMEIYKIPEARILIEPYARHTTTNLRNASRLLISNQIPVSQPILVVTNNNHTEYLVSTAFKERCLNELGYLPAIKGNNISRTSTEFFPTVESLHQNPIDPLDP